MTNTPTSSAPLTTDPTRCFCGSPIHLGASLTSDSDDSDWETKIYCTRACALDDALNALTARQTMPSCDGKTEGLHVNDFGSFTHYRRMFRAHGASSMGKKRYRRRPQGSVSSLSSASSPSASVSSSPSPSSSRIVDKPLPDLPAPDVVIRHGPIFRRNISNRYPPPMNGSQYNHTRNSSLSSFGDSSSTTSRTVSTRATSISSDCLSDLKCHSRKSSHLEGLLEEEEDSDSSGHGLWLETANAGAFRSGVGDGKLAQALSPIEPVVIGYDPFELDQLLLHTPRVVDPAPYEPQSLHVKHVVSPLRVISRASERPPVLPSPTLAPPIELNFTFPARSPSNDSLQGVSTSTLLPPPPFVRTQLASPSGFPTTPSLSPFVPTPTISPNSNTATKAIEKLAATFVSLSYSPPTMSMKPTFTLHRRRHPGNVPLEGRRGSPLGQGLSNLPITPSDPVEGNDYFDERNPVLGPGKPLFLEPLAGLGFDLDEIDGSKWSRDELRRVATFHNTNSNGSLPEDELLDYYFAGSEKEELRRAPTVR